MFLFGGSGNNTNSRNWETIYILNCETFEWEKVCPNDATGINTPEPRDSHACVRIGNSMYIFGGSNGENPLNDMFAFNLVSKTWNKIDTIGDTPSPREGHSGVALYDRYFFIFGGWDGKNIFQNCYLFDYVTSKWKIIEYIPGTEPLPRESHSCTLVNDYIYLFGGQGTSIKKKETYYNDLYKFKISIDKSSEKVTGVWEKIFSKNNTYPAPRTSHSIISYKERYLIVIGGEGYCPDNELANIEEPEVASKEDVTEENNNSEDSEDEDHPPCYPKSDVWIFDIFDTSWYVLEVKNQEIFMPRFTHSCSSYKDSLIIFGGLKDFKNSIDDLIILMLEDTDPKKPVHLCSSCKKMLDYSQYEEIQISENGKLGAELKKYEVSNNENEYEILDFLANNSKPSISLSVLPHLINLNNHPLASFGLFVENALLCESKTLKIQLEQKYRYGYVPERIPIKDNDHIENFFMIEFGNCDKNFFAQRPKILEGLLNFTEDLDRHHIFLKNLKLAGFKLGDTILLVIKRGTFIDLFFLSCNLKTNPDLNDYILFDCFWDTKDDSLFKEEDENDFLSILRISKKNILDNVSHILSENDLLNLQSTATVFVLNLKKVTFNKKTFSELMTKNGDILVRLPKLVRKKNDAKNGKKLLSLKSYLQHYFLNPTQNFEIFLNGKKINFTSFAIKNDDFKKIPQNLQICVENMSIIKCTSNQDNNSEKKNKILDESEENQSRNIYDGIYLYQNNRLIKKIANEKYFDSIIRTQFEDLHGFIQLKQIFSFDFAKSVIYSVFFV